MTINRGEVWLVNLNPVIGHEQAGTRPALIVSDDMLNHSLAEMAIVMPLTTKHKGIPTHVPIKVDFLEYPSYVKTEDIRSVSTKRLVTRIVEVDNEVMRLVEERIKLLLGLD